MIKSFIIVSVITLSLTACQMNNRNVGAAIGGIAGGFKGGKFNMDQFLGTA